MAKTTHSASQPAAEASASPSQSGRLTWVWWGAAALCLIGGFVDLWRGGTTVSAILLTIGYLVLVPVAILKR